MTRADKLLCFVQGNLWQRDHIQSRGQKRTAAVLDMIASCEETGPAAMYPFVAGNGARVQEGTVTKKPLSQPRNTKEPGELHINFEHSVPYCEAPQ